MYGTADGMAHKFRLVSFMQSLKEGNIRPRWAGSQALGLGAPVFLLNYSLPYYIVSGLVFFGFSIRTATYVFMGSVLLFSFVFMFLLTRKLYGKAAGIVSATIYLLAPYHLLVVYLYEGWGEMTAFVFPPLILYLTIKATTKSMYVFLLIFSWAGLFLSHNVSALLFTPIILLTSFIMLKNHGKSWMMCFWGFLHGVLLTAFFWLPSIVLSGSTRYPALIIREAGTRFLYYKSFSLHVINAFTTIQKGTTTYTDFTIGLALLVILIAGLLYGIITVTKGKKAHSHLQIFLCAVFLGGMIMASSWSDIVWNHVPQLSIVVYPFRFLFPATFAGSILGGYFAKKNKIIAGVFLVLAVISSIPYTRPWIDIFDFTNSYFSQPQTISAAPRTQKNMGTSEFLPAWASFQFLQKQEDRYLQSSKPPAKIEIDSKDGHVLTLASFEEKVLARIQLSKDTDLPLNIFYFPNWEADIDGKPVSVLKDSNGRIVVPMEKGIHTLRLVFGVSTVEKIGWGITGGTILLHFFILCWLFVKNIKYQTSKIKYTE